MYKDKNGIVIQCVNRKGMTYNGCKVPYMGLYGTFGHYEFVAEPRFNPQTKEMRLKHRDMKTKTRWDDMPSKEIVSHIIDAARVKCVKLYKWETKMVNPDRDEMKKDSEIWHKEASNPDCIRRKKFKMKYRQSSMSGHRYSELSCTLYGESIEMDGKQKKLNRSMQTYMDGTGMSSRFDNSDRRPLEPQFPVKSGKRK
jgi:hypothetical protein